MVCKLFLLVVLCGVLCYEAQSFKIFDQCLEDLEKDSIKRCKEHSDQAREGAVKGEDVSTKEDQVKKALGCLYELEHLVQKKDGRFSMCVDNFKKTAERLEKECHANEDGWLEKTNNVITKCDKNGKKYNSAVDAAVAIRACVIGEQTED